MADEPEKNGETLASDQSMCKIGVFDWIRKNSGEPGREVRLSLLAGDFGETVTEFAGEVK